jgi:hypothetical protein
MSTKWLLLTVLVAIAGCGGGSPLVGQTDATSSAGQCGHAAGLGDGKPGACGVGRALLDCEFPNGAGCGCVTNNATCDGCAGSTCTDTCDANEYAVSCGGIGPGDPSITYADPPAACRFASANPGGIAYYCCPCL